MLEIVEVDDGGEGRFFIGVRRFGGGFGFLRVEPGGGDGAGVEVAFFVGGREGGFDEGGGVVGVVGFAAVFAGPFVYHCLGGVSGFGGLVLLVAKGLLSGPPGWFGANVVRSYTLPFTTIQQSSGLACLSSSATEIFVSEVIVVVLKLWWYSDFLTRCTFYAFL